LKLKIKNNQKVVKKRNLKSWLFVPLDEIRFLSKINTLNSDIYILDLEDGVHKSKKNDARLLIYKLKEYNIDSDKIALRINNLSTKWVNEDIQVALENKIQHIIYPKIKSHTELIDLYKLIRNYAKNRLEPQVTPIIENIESFFNLENIIETSKSSDYIIFGSEDFLSKYGFVDRNYTNNLLLQSVVVNISLLCVKYDKLFIDCGCPYFVSLKDLDNFKNECIISKNLGAFGKLAIHPSQLNFINEIYNYSSNIADVDIIIKTINDILFIMSEKNKSVINYNNKLVGIPELRKYLSKLLTLKYLFPDKNCEIDEAINSLNKFISYE
jgi:citrate lyase subunit beta / citryl-CoA lyase